MESPFTHSIADDALSLPVSLQEAARHLFIKVATLECFGPHLTSKFNTYVARLGRIVWFTIHITHDKGEACQPAIIC